MDRRGKVPLEIEKVIKRQEVTETDMERGRFFGDIAEMRLTREPMGTSTLCLLVPGDLCPAITFTNSRRN